MDEAARVDRFMQRAIALAARGVDAGDGGPFGCVIARGDTIVGEGWNRVVATNDPTAHGEMMAIRAAAAQLQQFSLAGCELFTTGEPCPMCLGAIHWARIDAVHFALSADDIARVGFDDREFHAELARPREERRLRVHAARAELREAAMKVAEQWLARENRVQY